MTRPLIGLALGGGVARGWAHIGVLRALERAGIRPDIICGTSAGALVGGAYLAGHLDTLEDWTRSLTKRRIVGFLDVIVGGSGLLGGKHLARQMEKYIGGLNIEDLDRPFVAITGELATGHEVWLEKGPLVEAIQASYALPGVFSPRKLNGRWLIDGALVNPIPVSVCRAKGARIVIAVGLNADAFGRSPILETEKTLEDMDLEARKGAVRRRFGSGPQRVVRRQLFGHGDGAPGMGTVMLSSLNIVMDRLSRSRMAGDPPDVLVSPKCGHISMLDFDKADELIGLGDEAMGEQIPALRELTAFLT